MKQAPGFKPSARSSRPPSRALLLPALLVALVPILAPGPVTAQSAEEILTRAMEAHQDRLAGVDDLVIEQEVMGFSATTYMVKEEVDGRPVLRTRSTGAGGIQTGAGEVDPGDIAGEIWADPWGVYQDGIERWTLEGESSVDGSPTWRLGLTDFEGLDWDATVPGQDAPFEPRRLMVELEKERLIPLELQVEGEVMDGGELRPLALQMNFTDYREVEGYLHPFLMTMELDLAAAGVSADDAARARSGLEELQRQLEDMPESQRQMVEQMMGEQLRAFEGMLSGEGLQVDLRVTDLRVNGGTPGG
jgi:hypothetical protein